MYISFSYSRYVILSVPSLKILSYLLTCIHIVEVWISVCVVYIHPAHLILLISFLDYFYSLLFWSPVLSFANLHLPKSGQDDFLNVNPMSPHYIKYVSGFLVHMGKNPVLHLLKTINLTGLCPTLDTPATMTFPQLFRFAELWLQGL